MPFAEVARLTGVSFVEKSKLRKSLRPRGHGVDQIPCAPWQGCKNGKVRSCLDLRGSVDVLGLEAQFRPKRLLFGPLGLARLRNVSFEVAPVEAVNDMFEALGLNLCSLPAVFCPSNLLEPPEVGEPVERDCLGLHFEVGEELARRFRVTLYKLRN